MARRRPEPGEDFEEFVVSPHRCSSEPQLRRWDFSSPTSTPFAGDERSQFFFYGDEEPESPSQALSAMVERLYDEELRKREERRLAREMEREQELAREAPFAPNVRPRRCTEVHGTERHLILYEQRLDIAKRRRDLQEQKLRSEREYLDRHSVHRARSPRSPQANDYAVYQRLHEEAEIKRQRLKMQEAHRSPSSPKVGRASSMTSLRLYQRASEAAERRQKLQEQKLKEEKEYFAARSVHRARAQAQANPARISQRLHEEAQLKRHRLSERMREKDAKESELLASPTRRLAKDPAVTQRLFSARPKIHEAPFSFRAAIAPGESPKAMYEATRVPLMPHEVPSFSEQMRQASAVGGASVAQIDEARPQEEQEEASMAGPTADQIKAFCASAEALVAWEVKEPKPQVEVISLATPTGEEEQVFTGWMETSGEEVQAAQAPAERSQPTKVFATESKSTEALVSATPDIQDAALLPKEAEVSVPTAEDIKAFCESTKALVASVDATQEPKGTRRISLELDECF
ncbi:Uncharacterized protein SCF082_LOCUS19010 [Durusdinium trenchii]|uniref:Uncharacterized protein n=1 Tax=Durusdinium trenchii TaxID=1381693 RepID=A0ABP0KUN0_9DINO